MEIITWILSAPLLSDLKRSRNTSTTRFPFAYARLSPPAKESRGAEWVKSKQLVTLSESSHPTPPPPSSGLYAVGSTCLPHRPPKLPQNPPRTSSPSPSQTSSLQGASESSPGAGSFLGFLSIRLAVPEVLMTETGTKEALSAEFRGRMGKGDRY